MQQGFPEVACKRNIQYRYNQRIDLGPEPQGFWAGSQDIKGNTGFPASPKMEGTNLVTRMRVMYQSERRSSEQKYYKNILKRLAKFDSRKIDPESCLGQLLIWRHRKALKVP